MAAPLQHSLQPPTLPLRACAVIAGWSVDRELGPGDPVALRQGDVRFGDLSVRAAPAEAGKCRRAGQGEA